MLPVHLCKESRLRYLHQPVAPRHTGAQSVRVAQASPSTLKAFLTKAAWVASEVRGIFCQLSRNFLHTYLTEKQTSFDSDDKLIPYLIIQLRETTWPIMIQQLYFYRIKRAPIKRNLRLSISRLCFPFLRQSSRALVHHHRSELIQSHPFSLLYFYCNISIGLIIAGFAFISAWIYRTLHQNAGSLYSTHFNYLFSMYLKPVGIMTTYSSHLRISRFICVCG